MTSKHTQGPWHLQRYRNRHNIHIETNGFIDTKIAHIAQREEQYANAQLIAAAPELLAVCKLAQKYVAKMVADDVQTAVPPQIALNKIEQAIAKAEGEMKP